MKDKEKYFQVIEKNVVKSIYEEALSNNASYFDDFIMKAKGLSSLEPHLNFLSRCVMANDAEALVYIVVANKIVKVNDKLYNVINNEVKDELSEKLSLDIIRILIANKYIDYALKIMTKELYYKVHFLKDLEFLDNNLIQHYLFGVEDFPPYFANQFNDLEDKKDKKFILNELITLYGMILDEVPKYYCSNIKDNILTLEYPNDISKRDKKVTFRFLDLSELIYDGPELDKLESIQHAIVNLVRR